ncbi:DNA polymerase nu [Lingula anatina]|uniref:DNA polymerase nu n=1 Tax=Lingula anatina TaxID=7574 RepID=A0A1S3IZE0_LINAN|nr:DNA polymerase nu [Lingula anatina]|eukprot:XP_013403383.1 DNA polymerase nu [Lingula anatina]
MSVSDCILTPAKRPPHPKLVKYWSQDGELIFQSMLKEQEHNYGSKTNRECQRERFTHVPDQYYSSIYSETFGTPIPSLNTDTHSSYDSNLNLSDISHRDKGSADRQEQERKQGHLAGEPVQNHLPSFENVRYIMSGSRATQANYVQSQENTSYQNDWQPGQEHSTGTKRQEVWLRQTDDNFGSVINDYFKAKEFDSSQNTSSGKGNINYQSQAGSSTSAQYVETNLDPFLKETVMSPPLDLSGESSSAISETQLTSQDLFTTQGTDSANEFSQFNTDRSLTYYLPLYHSNTPDLPDSSTAEAFIHQECLRNRSDRYPETPKSCPNIARKQLQDHYPSTMCLTNISETHTSPYLKPNGLVDDAEVNQLTHFKNDENQLPAFTIPVKLQQQQKVDIANKTHTSSIAKRLLQKKITDMYKKDVHCHQDIMKKTPISSITKRLLQQKDMPNSSSKKVHTSPLEKTCDDMKRDVLKVKDVNIPTSQTGKSFKVPYKKNKNDTACNNQSKICEDTPMKVNKKIQQLANLSSDERHQLLGKLLLADEIAMTLLYADGSSQLREPTARKKRGIVPEDQEAVSMVLAYQSKENIQPSIAGVKRANSLLYVAFPLCSEDEECFKWSRSATCTLMAAKCRKICFDSQELMSTLISKLDLDPKTVISQWLVFDPRICCWILDPDQPPCTFTQMLKSLQDTGLSIPEGDSTEPVCEDLCSLGPVMQVLYQKLSSRHLWDLYTKLEMPLTTMLAVMELRRIQVDTSCFLKSGDLLKKKLTKLELAANVAAGHSFSINSHSQLRQVLFEELKLDAKLPKKAKIAKTSVGQQKSTSEAVLSQLKDLHPLPKIVLEYRQLQKLKSTYIDGMLAFVENGYLSTHWDQTAAATGRLTSTSPNIQAIPKLPVVLTGVNITEKEDEKEQQVFARDPFVSRDGWSFLAADFSQIELRLLAHLSDDTVLLGCFNRDGESDIFVELTALWLCKAADDVSMMEREQTKRVVYSVMYGVGKNSLADYLKMSPNEAKAIMTSFLVKFPGVNMFTRKCIEQCRTNGYVCTIFKRRRWFPNIKHPSPMLRAQAERQAVNFCVQGSAADLCKAAMLQVEHTLSARAHLSAQLLVQIHDELLLEVPDSEIEETKGVIRGIMESSEGLCGDMTHLKLPLKVSLSCGKTWGHMTPC